MHNAERNRVADGFTLIEVLIVIVILGILATVVVFAVGGVTGQGEDSICATDESTLATAIEAYKAVNETKVLPSTGAAPGGYEVTLVNAGVLRAPSVYWNFNAAGDVVPQPGATC